jgi:hypothetical protein
MVDFWNRIVSSAGPEPAPPEPLSREKIEAGYRLYWTKMALRWDAERRAQVAQDLAAALQAPDFEANALERRFHVRGADDQAHSGASLLALEEVLQALDAYDENE